MVKAIKSRLLFLQKGVDISTYWEVDYYQGPYRSRSFLASLLSVARRTSVFAVSYFKVLLVSLLSEARRASVVAGMDIKFASAVTGMSNRLLLGLSAIGSAQSKESD